MDKHICSTSPVRFIRDFHRKSFQNPTLLTHSSSQRDVRYIKVGNYHFFVRKQITKMNQQQTQWPKHSTSSSRARAIHLQHETRNRGLNSIFAPLRSRGRAHDPRGECDIHPKDPIILGIQWMIRKMLSVRACPRTALGPRQSGLPQSRAAPHKPPRPRWRIVPACRHRIAVKNTLSFIIVPDSAWKLRRARAPVQTHPPPPHPPSSPRPNCFDVQALTVQFATFLWYNTG